MQVLGAFGRRSHVLNVRLTSEVLPLWERGISSPDNRHIAGNSGCIIVISLVSLRPLAIAIEIADAGVGSQLLRHQIAYCVLLSPKPHE